MGKGILKGQLKMEDIAAEMKKKEKPSPFKLTVAEKRLIKAYYRYRCVICERPSICDILCMFKWDEPTRERYVAAWRDYSLDDQLCEGAFHAVRGAIAKYLNELNEKNGSFFDEF